MSDIANNLRRLAKAVRLEGRRVGPGADQLDQAAAEIEQLRAEFKRFMDICGEGSSRGRPMDLIPRADWERARDAARERKDKIG